MSGPFDAAFYFTMAFISCRGTAANERQHFGKSDLGQSRHFGRRPTISGLLLETDIVMTRSPCPKGCHERTLTERRSFPRDQTRSWPLLGVKRSGSALVVTSYSDPPLKLATSTHLQFVTGSRSCRAQIRLWTLKKPRIPSYFPVPPVYRVTPVKCFSLNHRVRPWYGSFHPIEKRSCRHFRARIRRIPRFGHCDQCSRNNLESMNSVRLRFSQFGLSFA